MVSIDEQLEKLPRANKKYFDKCLLNSLYSRRWCLFHNIDYANPDVQKAKELLYNEMLNKQFS